MISRPSNIEEILCEFAGGKWWDWSDKSDRVYANLIVVDDSVIKPTEAEVNVKLAEMQALWDSRNAEYVLNRQAAYPSIAEQLDMQYHDKINGTTTWADAIQAVKDKYPKPE